MAGGFARIRSRLAPRLRRRPVLASAVVSCDCRTVEIKAVASHNVIFGAVEAVRLGPPGPALVYHDRLYKKV